jgi:hypothetical protein
MNAGPNPRPSILAFVGNGFVLAVSLFRAGKELWRHP